MRALGFAEAQHPRDVLEEGGRDLDRLSLLQPRVPAEPHAGARRDLLAPEPLRPAPAREEPGRLREDSRAPGLEEIRQFLPALPPRHGSRFLLRPARHWQ